MSFKYRQQLPAVAEVILELPLSPELAEVKRERDRAVSDIISGRSGRFLLIIGPCSADNEDAVCEYVSRLAKLQQKVEQKLLLLPRIYTNKPRTTGIGYKGMAHQPDPNDEPNIVEGLIAIRKMHIRALGESGLSSADEMLYPFNYPYLEDVLSYVAIGARSVENQEHRLTVSGLDIPAGMKNPTGGDMGVMLNSIRAGHAPHIFSYTGWEVATPGNPLTHAILRGAVSPFGRNVPNYHYEDIINLHKLYLESGLPNPAVLVDVSHANSNRQFKEQPRVAREVLASLKYDPRLRGFVRGLMIESYLCEGSQDPSGSVYGQSITDACLGWEDSERLVLDIADLVV
ncbi:MAG: 3-deoxy-7-phosphoheptulonate synthase [Candidatus Omnitrophica bacterium]|nr:3-deoxy-7-phosphoheptulonate synthase [Candidatus Omnitrophota bacterium]